MPSIVGRPEAIGPPTGRTPPRPMGTPWGGGQLAYRPRAMPSGPALGAMINRIPAPQMQRNWFGAGPAGRPLGPREAVGAVGDLFGALYGQARRPVNAWMDREGELNRYYGLQKQLVAGGIPRQQVGPMAGSALQAQQRRMPRT